MGFLRCLLLTDAGRRRRCEHFQVQPEQIAASLGAREQLVVTGHFADGSSEDVTWLCSFESRDEMIATVDEAGRVRAAGIGDTTLI